MTPQQAREFHGDDITDLAEEMAGAVRALLDDLPEPSKSVCVAYDEVCRRVAAHDQNRTISHLALVFGMAVAV